MSIVEVTIDGVDIAAEFRAALGRCPTLTEEEARELIRRTRLELQEAEQEARRGSGGSDVLERVHPEPVYVHPGLFELLRESSRSLGPKGWLGPTLPELPARRPCSRVVVGLALLALGADP